jgi:predicted nucleic acid-binding protein
MSDNFIDSNVFVYLVDETGDRRRQVAEALVFRAIEARDACISFQVVQETLNVITSKLATPVRPEDAPIFFERFLAPIWTVMPSASIYLRALSVQARYRYSFYDSLIIAAALEAGCTRLLSEDLQAGQTIDGLRIEDPFVRMP